MSKKQGAQSPSRLSSRPMKATGIVAILAVLFSGILVATPWAPPQEAEAAAASPDAEAYPLEAYHQQEQPAEQSQC